MDGVVVWEPSPHTRLIHTRGSFLGPGGGWGLRPRPPPTRVGGGSGSRGDPKMGVKKEDVGVPSSVRCNPLPPPLSNCPRACSSDMGGGVRRGPGQGTFQLLGPRGSDAVCKHLRSAAEKKLSGSPGGRIGSDWIGLGRDRTEDRRKAWGCLGLPWVT